MTNREWLNTLTDEQLVLFWKSWNVTFLVNGKEEMTATGIGRQWTSSQYALTLWLSEEHKQ